MSEVKSEMDVVVAKQRGGDVLESAVQLDHELRDRLASVADAERAGDEQFASSRRVLVESAVWVAAGLVAWLLVIVLWT